MPFLVQCSWNNSLAIDDLDAQRSELQQLRNRGKVYNSAMLDAMDANKGQGENMLPRTDLFGIHYPNLLISVERADELWQASGEHVDGACFQVALASCRLPKIVRLCVSTIICKRIAPRRLIASSYTVLLSSNNAFASFVNLFIDYKGIKLLRFSFFTSAYNQKRQLLQWVRKMPLLKELPQSLAMYLARGVDNL
jgi:hypothetical protein